MFVPKLSSNSGLAHSQSVLLCTDTGLTKLNRSTFNSSTPIKTNTIHIEKTSFVTPVSYRGWKSKKIFFCQGRDGRSRYLYSNIGSKSTKLFIHLHIYLSIYLFYIMRKINVSTVCTGVSLLPTSGIDRECQEMLQLSKYDK